MAPLKFEDKIKEKLEHRAIEPSVNLWDKLEKQLDQAQNKKGNKKIWWYSLAAVFVGVLILTSIFYKNPVADQTNDQFVDRSKEIVKRNDTELVRKNDQDAQKVIENEETKTDTYNTEEKTIVNSENKKQTIQKIDKSKSQLEVELQEKVSNDIIEREVKKNNVVAQNNEEKIDLKKQEEVLSISPEVINTKVADIVAQVEELQKNNTEVTDEEIDKLLRKAQRDITTERILKSNTVSASALLQDVEEEIDETFKQRVFEALKAGFQKVKSAVAEREN